MHKSRIEGYHGELRLRGIGLDGADAPRTPNTVRAVRWLHYGRAYRITMRTLVLRNGTYERSSAEATEFGLLRAPDHLDLEYTRGRKDEDADPPIAGRADGDEPMA